jgi:hypothetical protein
MANRMLAVCAVAVLFCTAEAGDDPKQDLDDKEGRSRVLAGVQAPVRQLDGYQ